MLSTPERKAHTLMHEHDISLCRKPVTVKELSAFNTLIQHVAWFPKTLKSRVMKSQTVKHKHTGYASHLARKIGMDQHRAFSNPKSRTGRTKLTLSLLRTLAHSVSGYSAGYPPKTPPFYWGDPTAVLYYRAELYRDFRVQHGDRHSTIAGNPHAVWG